MSNSTQPKFAQTITGIFSLRQMQDIVAGLNALIEKDPLQSSIEVDIDGSITDLRDMLQDSIDNLKANPITNLDQTINGYCL